LSQFGQDSDSAIFDFLKDGKHKENKYKSTNQIPYLFNSEDLFSTKNANMDTAADSHMQYTKDEAFTPFFAIEEDLEMEDEVSNSDYFSETGQESIDSDNFPQPKGKLLFLLTASATGLPCFQNLLNSDINIYYFDL